MKWIHVTVNCRGDRFRFDSIFIKKYNQIKYFFKKTETEPKPVQTDQFRFGSVFLGQKPVWIGFSVWLGFGSVFLV
jgi:hypothetical protein